MIRKKWKSGGERRCAEQLRLTALNERKLRDEPAREPAHGPGDRNEEDGGDGHDCASISPGTSAALVQLAIPVDQTSVSPRTIPLAINSRSRSSENGPSCLPSRPVYHCRSAICCPLRSVASWSETARHTRSADAPR